MYKNKKRKVLMSYFKTLDVGHAMVSAVIVMKVPEGDICEKQEQ